ncbi:hypothetical protein GIS00_17810 [Nakamurella sp. YIM 132087]|uniref:YCII-related domain-containing protein n=1 Tax=Nakamurella alba TaxID=2665158 RepID=A0A7K1FSH1_9ACTN|nr:YciI family protein [Nakamurella alba]MTD15794.1 hypothetical protein [Nakamurella alba]
MKYLLSLYGNKELWASIPAEDWPGIIATQDAFNAKYAATGEMIAAYGLAEEDQVKVIRVRDGKATVTDGPYVEAKEFMGSTSILDVESEERALEIAADAPFAAFRSVELWPLLHEAAQNQQ